MAPGRGSLFMVQATNRPLVALKSTRAWEVSEESGPGWTDCRVGVLSYLNLQKWGTTIHHAVEKVMIISIIGLWT